MDMRNVLGLILGGGRGSRLFPLTSERAKPAVPLAGKYRLIDIPMSNCFHAGIERIAILTQFNTASLHRHIHRTYTRDMFSNGWTQILAAEQTYHSENWYQGTADAVRKQSVEIRSAGMEYTLILSGDHLYRMDYEEFCSFHVESGADVTIAVQPVSRETAPALGILKLDNNRQIVEFQEKPKDPAVLDRMATFPNTDKPFMASMGIYVFKTDTLFELLEQEGDDFGKQIIPQAMEDKRLAGYVFDGFWADIGTIRSFYDVNLAMTRADAPFDLYDRQRPIYTRPRFLPGSEVYGGHLNNVLMGDGCRLQNATVRDSVVGLRSIVEKGATLNSVVMMGADYYETPEELAANKRNNLPNMGVGKGSLIDTAIIDKNARIGDNVVIRNVPDRPDEDHPNWISREGIVIIPKGAAVPNNTVI